MKLAARHVQLGDDAKAIETCRSYMKTCTDDTKHSKCLDRLTALENARQAEIEGAYSSLARSFQRNSAAMAKLNSARAVLNDRASYTKERIEQAINELLQVLRAIRYDSPSHD
jgi:molecular chaperone GrpE (heat shock protein)